MSIAAEINKSISPANAQQYLQELDFDNIIPVYAKIAKEALKSRASGELFTENGAMVLALIDNGGLMKKDCDCEKTQQKPSAFSSFKDWFFDVRVYCGERTYTDYITGNDYDEIAAKFVDAVTQNARSPEYMKTCYPKRNINLIKALGATVVVGGLVAGGIALAKSK